MTKDEAREILIRYNDWRRYGKPDPINLAIDCAIQALGDGWIRVDEKLPDADEFVLFYYPNRFEKPLIGCYKPKQGTKGVFLCTEDNEDWMIEADGITHWKKLEPPKPKQP